MRLTGSKPASLKVGTAGSCGSRCGAATTMGTSWPDWMKGRAEGRLSNTMATWPATVSLRAGPEPRYGMCVTKAPDRLLYSSICRWPMEPVPAVPKLYLPGLRRSTCRKVAGSRAGKLGCTAMTLGVAAMLMMGVKSATGS